MTASTFEFKLNLNLNIEVVDSIEKSQEVCGKLMSEKEIAVDLEGSHLSRNGTVSLVNIADASGNVYRRKEVAFEEYVTAPDRRIPGYVDENLYLGVKVTDVYDDMSPGRMI